jgi:hypothetical protein
VRKSRRLAVPKVSRSERKKVLFQGTCQEMDAQKKNRCWDCYILDISRSGCLILGDLSFLSDRTIVPLDFKIPWTGEHLEALTRVVRSEVTDRGIQIGLEFVKLCPENTRRLNDLIKLLSNQDLLVRMCQMDESSECVFTDQ